MKNEATEVIISSQCQLGEGPYYSKVHNCLFWVDIIGQSLFRLDWQTKQMIYFGMPEPICWIMETQDGQLVAGFEKGIYRLDSNTFERQLLFSLANEPNSNRLNDGKTDRNGHGFFGTMDKEGQRTSGSLYRFGHGKPPEQVDSNYTISNGPAVSRSGDYLYSTASDERTIYRFSLDDQGQLSDKQPFITFTDEMGFPDGMTVDSDDHIWVAAWNGYGLYRFSPTGEQRQFIRLPVPQVTSIAFVGEGLKHIAVTTASIGLNQKALNDYPHSGSVFILKVDVKGLPEAPIIL